MSDLIRITDAYFEGREELAREMSETCRHWLSDRVERCGEPATIIVWGKYSAPDEFGPRCSQHWPDWVSEDQIEQYAVFDLRPALRVLDNEPSTDITKES